MAAVLYKSFDSSQFLFENIWRIFPTIRTEQRDDKIINKLIVSSREFCDLSSKNIFRMKINTQGGFGDVGTFKVGNKIIKAIVFSFERTGKKNNIFLCDMIVKNSNNREKINKIFRLNMSTVSITDPLSDMIFGSIMGHMYDIGVNPFVTKYFGTYLCNRSSSAIFIEKSNKELREKLNRNIANRINPVEFKNVLIQYLYCIYLLKIYYGAVHFDTHLRNIMLTDVEETNYMYHGIHFSELKYILLETGVKDSNNIPFVVVLKKSRYIVKLIDYGCMMVCFDRSEFPRFKRDLRIETNINDITSIGALKALNMSRRNKSYANTVDVLFSLINIYVFLKIGLENSELKVPDITAAIDNAEYLAIVNRLTYSLFKSDMDTIIYNNPEFIPKKKPDGSFMWFMNNHDTGIKNGFENPSYLMSAIISSCTSSSYIDKFPFKKTKYFNKKINAIYFENLVDHITPENSIFLTHNASDYNRAFNRFENILDFSEKCIFSEQSCEVLKLYDQIPYETFTGQKLLEDNENFKISAKDTSDVNFKYKSSNTWLNASDVPSKKINSIIEDVRIHFITIKKFSTVTITVNDFLSKTNGMSVPVGNSAIFRNRSEPLGFYASSSEILQHLYPEEYNNFLGILNLTVDNRLVLEKYSEFLTRHETHIKTHYINTNLKAPIETIKTPLKLKYGSKYKWAVTVGPILVWNREIVFNENTLEKESKEILYGNKSKKLFVGKTPGYYSMTDSQEIQSHIIYVKRKNHQGFLMIEGGGFQLQGLSRIHTAILCKNIGVEYAVCVSSGYSTNVLVKRSNSEDKKYLSKSPIRLCHGSTINFHW